MAAVGIPRFQLEVLPDRSRVVLCIHGELDMATVPQVEHALRELRELGWSMIALDLGAVTFIDTTGLGSLLSLHRSALSGGWKLTIATSCPALERLMIVSRLEHAFPRG